MNVPSRLERPVAVFRALVHELRVEKVTFMAGSIAYHATVSLLPLLLLVLTVLSSVGARSFEASFLDLLRAAFTPEVGSVLLTRLRGASTGLSIAGGLLLVWGALRIFRGLDQAFSAIYETERENSIRDQFVDGLVVLVSFALAVLVAEVLHTALSELGDGPLAGITKGVVLVFGLSLSLVPMYYVFPDVDLTVREILPGVIVTAIGLAVFETLFRIYVDLKSPGGVVAGVLVLLTWLYVNSLVVLVGAAVNAVLSNRSRDIDIEPVWGGIEKGRTHRTARSEAAPLGERLKTIESIAENGEELLITADGTEVRLPPPQRTRIEKRGHDGSGAVAVEGTTGEGAVEKEDTGEGTVDLELRWSDPRDEHTADRG